MIEDLKAQVMDALGHDLCFSALLQTGRTAVVSPRADFKWNGPIRWSIEANKEKILNVYSGPNERRKRAFFLFKRALPSHRSAIEFAGKVTALRKN